MHTRRVITSGEPEPDLNNPEQIRAADTISLAVSLLREAFELPDDDGVVSRGNLIRGFTRDLPRGQREPLSRRLAEAFQALEHAGMVCEDVEESRPGWYFLTAAGRYLLRSSAPQDELRMRSGS